MRRVRGYQILFGLTLLALASLGGWWLVFFLRSIELERTAGLNELTHVTVVTALMLGQGEAPPALGPVGQDAKLEVVAAADRQSGDLFAAAVPRHPRLGVRPRPEAVQAIEDKLARRRLMFAGEGALLFLLLMVCTYMLYRLVRLEHRQINRMEMFLSTITHEMKTPLTGIKSMLQTFAAGLVPETEQARLYAMGLRETERLEHMVENVLISGRLRTERYPVFNKSVALRPLLEGFLEHRRRYRVDRPDAFDLVWEPARQELTVRCDPSALHVVLENLTDNALKYGGDPPRVTVRVQRLDGRVLVAVEDRGVGFSPEAAESLFVPFRRARDGKAAVQHGTGLGLSIARALTRRMGGELSAQSEGPDKGSRFVVALEET